MTTDSKELPPLPVLEAMTERVEVWGLMQDYARLAIQQERERCAKIAEDAEVPTFMHGGREFDDSVLLLQNIAAAIRKGMNHE